MTWFELCGLCGAESPREIGKGSGQLGVHSFRCPNNARPLPFAAHEEYYRHVLLIYRYPQRKGPDGLSFSKRTWVANGLEGSICFSASEPVTVRPQVAQSGAYRSTARRIAESVRV